MNQDNGGIIGKINTPTTSLASGVWSLDSQFDSQSSSIWPLAFPNTTIANSCRFSKADNTYLSKTTGTATNTDICTLSVWIKRSTLSSNDEIIIGEYTNSSNRAKLLFNADQLHFFQKTGGSTTADVKTTRVFEDSSAWYHIVIAFDTTQSTDSDRIKFYINGVQETAFDNTTYPSSGQNIRINESSITQLIGYAGTTNTYYDGYMAEVVFVDGQQLLPTSFGAFNPVTNIWEPIAYAGTYGTNGFRFDFADSSALGNDVSGNDNDYTVNNLTSVDQSADTCSNNFATFNRLIPSTLTYSDGNLTIERSSGDWESSGSTIAVTKGKWYAEFKWVSGTYTIIGVEDMDLVSTWDNEYIGYSANGRGYGWDGNARNNASSSSFGNSFSTGDIIGVALDMDNKFVYMSKNGTFQNSGDPTSGSSGTGGLSLAGSLYTIGASGYSSVVDANFGSPEFSISSGNSDANGFGNFEYSVPSGYFSLCTKNLAEFGG